MPQPPTKIRKRNGTLTEFRENKIKNAIKKAAEAVNCTDTETINQLVNEIVTKISQKYENQTPTVEDIQDIVEETLLKSKLHEVAKAYIIYRRKRAEERAAKAALVGRLVKTNLSFNALRLLKERYLQKKPNEKTETPDELFLRVAKTAATQEEKYCTEKEVKSLQIRFYNMLRRLDFLPNTPALINAGKNKGTMFSSTAFTIPDSIEGIYDTLKKAAVMQRYGSGTGFNFSKLRPYQSTAGGIKNLAQGPIPHLETYDHALSKIKQLGIRQGANMAILSIHHPDILDFITAKAKEQKITNFNLSVALTEEFMEAVVMDKEYNLINPKTNKPEGTIQARQVFDILVASAWNYGEPGVLFTDVIESNGTKFEVTSPCAEMLLENEESGIVGAINLANMVDDGKINWQSLTTTTQLAVRLLDDLIDASYHPIQEILEKTRKNRKIGVGVMGFAHMLARLKIPYDSEEAVETAEKIMAHIKKTADETSKELGKLKGYSPDGTHRNLTRTAISPTGSISMIADCSPGIEPIFSVSYIRYVSGGREYYYLDKYLEEALEQKGILTPELVEKIAHNGLNTKEIPEDIKRIFTMAHEINPKWHIEMQAAFQKYTDNAISKTVNLPRNASLIDVENAILLAYKLGCKGLTVYREGSRKDEIFKLAGAMKEKKPTKIPRVLDELKAKLENKQLNDYY